MNANQAIRSSLDSAHMVLTAYLNDLEDADLFVRPVPGTKHIAWQLGHLIKSENEMMEMVRPGSSPKLPDGFAECYTKETTEIDDPSKFHTKADYLELYGAQRRATLEILETLSESDLDAPGPEPMREYFPTVGALMALQGGHELMHAGQFVAVRRLRGKPIVI